MSTMTNTEPEHKTTATSPRRGRPEFSVLLEKYA